MVLPAEQEASAEPQESGQEAQRPEALGRPDGGGSDAESGRESVEISQDHRGDDVPKRVARDLGHRLKVKEASIV